MILHAIELESFGRFVQPARFRFAPDRPNLITGPNGSGKSTLLAALSAAFVISHRSNAEDIRRWQPWARSLAPRVAVEFESRGKRYRLSKTFLLKPGARLEEEGAAGFLPVAEGDDAEARLSEFLGGPERQDADSKTREWLAAGVLWVPQNALANMKVEAPVQEAVRASFGAQTRSQALERILAEAEERYKEFWTPKGKVKVNSELQVLRDAVQKLEGELNQLRPKLEELDRLSEAQAELQIKAAGLESMLELEQKRLDDLKQAAARRAGLLQQRQTLLAEQNAKQAEGQLLKGILDSRATLGKRRSQHLERLAQFEQEAQSAAEALKEAEAALAHAVEDQQKKLEEARTRLESLHAPPAQILQELESLAVQMAELKTKLESALLHVEFLPERDVRIEVAEGEPGGWQELAQGQPLRVSGSPRIELYIEGLGRLRLTGPAESAAELTRQLSAARERWDKLTAPYGSLGLEELRRRHAEADAVTLEIERLRQALLAHEQGRSAEAVAREAARRAKEAADQRLAAEQQEALALEAEQRRLQSEPRTDPELQQALQTLAFESLGLQEQIRRLDEEIAAFPPALDEQVSHAQQSVASLERALTGARSQLNKGELRLAELQGQAVYSAIAEKEAELEETRSRLARVQCEADAWRLLKGTLEEVLEEREAEILPQVAERAAALLERFTGGFVERIELEPGQWQPEKLRPASAGVDVAPDRISGGEQEQLHLAVRLALADLLTADEPFPVVLDDALLSTDDARLGRILELVRERQPRIQWLILTCHPERFRALTDACRISIQAAGAAG